MNNPIYIHLYFNPEEVEQFKDKQILYLYGYTKETKGSKETLHLSLPLWKAKRTGEGEYEFDLEDFGGEF